ncbi:MAG TPA: type I DNA topoisomerase [Patescibacteria group bacterium]|nr:type I DNA topoisomerase [Patescibacteria group bacterium]
MTETIELEGYCLKCKEKRIIFNPKAEWAANGSPATRGKCPVCDTNMYKRGHTAAHDNLPKPEPSARSKKPKAKKRASSNKSKSQKKDSGSNNQRRLSGRLVIVESPAKAKTIGRYLGQGYKVMSSVGHVRDLLKSRLSVDVDSEFKPEYRVPNDKRKLVKELKVAASSAKEIFLATDPDREGEAIAWHVQESAEMDPSRVRRVEFQEITKTAVQAAFEHPRDIDMDRVDAQQARRILDRLVGYKLSPLLWRKIRGRLSAGRVQSVAVRLIVERERLIDAFEQEEYWTIEADLSKKLGAGTKIHDPFRAKLHAIDGREPSLVSEEQVQPHIARLEQAKWSVTKVKLGKRTRRPTAPFTTSTLQQEASRKLNFGTSKSMYVAQQLYEGVDLGPDGTVGLITYIRTDSLTVAAQAQDEARSHIIHHFGSEYAPKKPPLYKTKSRSAQEAHEAIRPTSVERTPKKIKGFLSRDQYRQYKLIWERFVASQMSPARYDTVRVDIKAGEPELTVEDRPYLFRAAGSTLIFSGFLALYEETRPADRPVEGDEKVPSNLEKGDILDLLKLLPEQHFTQPPIRYSEATLVKTLEENGIGRPSTYASIISTIQSRGYVEQEQKRLFPTPIGELVNDLLVTYFPDVMSVDFTARMESELDEIAGGSPWVPVIDEFYSRFSARLDVADEAIEKIDIEKELEYVGRDCPLCGNPLVFREGRYGRFVGCSNFPSCRHTEQILVKVGVTCPNDGGDIIEKRTRKGRIFYGCANYPKCDWVSWKRPLTRPCPNCQGLLMVANKSSAECTSCGERYDLDSVQEESVKEEIVASR